MPISVGRIDVVDFGDPADRATANTSVQELTGDWRAYPSRRSVGTAPIVRSDVSSAPTQSLGEALASDKRVSGFLSPSAPNANRSNLIVFPNRVRLDEQRRTIKPI